MESSSSLERARPRLGAWLVRWVLCLLPLAAAAGTCRAADADLDLHRYWDTRCKDCHGDAGAFARRTLRVQDGRLIGAHHEKDLDLFLQHHYLTPALVGAVKRMLAAQVTTPPLFARHCSRCHDSAAEFARKSLTLRSGAPVGRDSGQPVAEFLKSHGGLPPEQVPVVVETLGRVLREIGPGRDGG